MAEKNPYSPLVVPGDWKGTMRNFGVQLSQIITDIYQRISKKASKVTDATDGNFAALDREGNLVDSGHKHSDYLTEHQDISHKADLDQSGKVPSSQLPSYVDDVLEYESLSAFPLTGETGKIYVALDTNKDYRWSGSTYIELSKYNEATQSASGLMSAADKRRLDWIGNSDEQVCADIAAVKTYLGQQWLGIAQGQNKLLRIRQTNSSEDSTMTADETFIGYLYNPDDFNLVWVATTYFTNILIVSAQNMATRPSVSFDGWNFNNIGSRVYALENGVGAINGKLETENLGTLANQSALESALAKLGGSMSAMQFKNIRFNFSPTPTSGAFSGNNGYYIGTLKRVAANRYTVEVQCDRVNSTTVSGDLVVGAYYNSSWVWHNISDEIETLLSGKLDKSGGTITGDLTVNGALTGNKGYFAGDNTSSTADANLFAGSGLHVRECGRVGSAQTDLKYAPRIAFRWSGRSASSIFYDNNTFYFMKQNGTDTARIAADIIPYSLYTSSSATPVNNYTWDQLIASGSLTKFFSNWNDTTHFPEQYGAGVRFGATDGNNRFLFYMKGRKAWLKSIYNTTETEWAEILTNYKTANAFTVDSAVTSKFSVTHNKSCIQGGVFYLNIRINLSTSVATGTGEITIGKFATAPPTSLSGVAIYNGDSSVYGYFNLATTGMLYINFPVSHTGSSYLILNASCALD